MLKKILYIFALILLGCASSPDVNQKVQPWSVLDDQELMNSYSIGLVYADYKSQTKYNYPSISGGLVIFKLSQLSNAYAQGVKTGWVLLSADGVSLAADGAQTVSDRLKNKSKPDVIRFEIYDGSKNIVLDIERQVLKDIYKGKDSFVEAQ